VGGQLSVWRLLEVTGAGSLGNLQGGPFLYCNSVGFFRPSCEARGATRLELTSDGCLFPTRNEPDLGALKANDDGGLATLIHVEVKGTGSLAATPHAPGPWAQGFPQMCRLVRGKWVLSLFPTRMRCARFTRPIKCLTSWMPRLFAKSS
jgi:hypothetical protein